ncbi:hypothetical protein HYU96_01365 [Candidatus Daviesbacteria bacterium]|nr:hypothetical protein [Candidatus Daviesbacteria bacterium]
MIYRKFKPDKKVYAGLSEDDKKVLAILGGVVKEVARVYELQLKDGFYPKGISKKVLEEAAKKDPEILSPFSFVEKKNVQLEAVPYHQKYAEYLIPISKKIEKAARICKNKSLRFYLKARAKSLIDGSYREADIAWLNVKNSNIDFSVGPFERYLDKILFIKRIFQAHVGIIHKEKTAFAEKIKDTLYASAKLSTEKYHSTNIPKKGVAILVENCLASSGYMADTIFSREHFPSDLDVMQQHGAKVLIYQSQMDLRFKKLYYYIFKSLFEKRFAQKYSRELLYEAVSFNALIYELGRMLHKFSGSRERLKELYGPIDEANSFASGLEHSKHLVVKGLISQDKLEAMIIMHIVWMFTDWLIYQHNNKVNENHIVGGSILLNSYFSHGALHEAGGVSWPNFSKIFFEIETLAYQLVALLQRGSYSQVQQFIKRNADLSIYQRLGKKLDFLTASFIP